MKTTVSFLIPQFNSIGHKEVNFKALETAEETFRSICKSLDDNWQSVEFEFKGQTILVCKHWLHETNFNWEESHQIQ